MKNIGSAIGPAFLGLFLLMSSTMNLFYEVGAFGEMGPAHLQWMVWDSHTLRVIGWLPCLGMSMLLFMLSIGILSNDK